jgi:hypothetical protein
MTIPHLVYRGILRPNGPQSTRGNAMDPNLEAEFDMFLARAGMTIPPDRRETVLATYADFRGQMALLHTRRDAAEEPSNIFRAKGA